MAAGLPHVVMMADPCTGGAMASYATCASTILAEPRALLSFAGPRVLQLAGLPVDERRLVSETYARHGGIDEIVPRKLLRSRLRRHLEEVPPAMQTAARRRRALARRRVSAWFGEIINQLSGVIDGAHGLFEAQASEQANVVAELAELWHAGIPALLAQAAVSSNVRVRANAVAALSRAPDCDASVVERALGDSHHRVRAEAALGVLQRHPEHQAARRTVVELLTGSDSATRRHGLYVATGAPLAVFLPHIRRLAEDADPAVRLAAGVAAVAAGEIDLGLDLIRAVMAERGSRDSGRVERLIALMTPGDARWLRERLELE